MVLLIGGCSLKKEDNSIGYLFYQPLLKDKINWDSSFQKMKEHNIDNLILQWSRFGVVDFIKDDKWLKEILQKAQKYNIKVIIGLYGDDRYFKKLEEPKTDIKEYLKSLENINISQAKKIYKIAKNYQNFDGWYMYDEIDDTNFVTPNRQKYLKEYLQSIASSLNSISKKRLYISGYFSNHLKPKEYVEMFLKVTQKRYIVLVQSGVGANLVDIENSKRYMREFHRVFRDGFIPIVEAFKFEDSKPKALEKKLVQKQIKALKDSSKVKKVAIFSLRYFLIIY
jgi:hypothetical protein